MNLLRFVRWSIINAAFGVCVYYALFQSIEWCDNIMVFFTWLMTVIMVLTLFTKSGREEMRAKGRAAPSFVSIAYDITLITTLAAFGRFGLATLWTIESIVEYAIYHHEDK
jgi:hypothetical protein